MKFFIPTETKIFGQTINIKLMENLKLDGKIVDGLSCFHEGSIHISVIQDGLKFKKTQMELTYTHELCHQVFDMLGEHAKSHNEKLIYNFSSALYQYLSSAKYDKEKDFIPKTFTFFGQDVTVIRKKILKLDGQDQFSKLIMAQNKIEVIDYGLKKNDMIIPDDKVDIHFLRAIVIWIFELIGETTLSQNAKLNWQVSSAIHQSLIEAS